LIRNLPKDEGTLVVAFGGYSLLDFATSLYEWYNAKVGKATPNINSAAFVNLMTTQLRLADQVDDELQMKDEHKAAKITLTFVRNNSSNTWKFANTFLATTQLDFEKLEAFFNKHVEVKFIDSSNWTPRWADQAEAMAKTRAHYQEYMLLAGEKGDEF
jgi:hypothetical protein